MRCIDAIQNYNESSSESEGEDDGEDFFDKQRKTRLSIYDIHMLTVKREKKIKCIRCKKYSLDPEDAKPRINSNPISAMLSKPKNYGGSLAVIRESPAETITTMPT